MSINRRIHKEDVVHIHKGYYSAIKKNETMPSAATWRDLETATQSQVSQTEKDNYSMTSLTCGV